MVDSNPVLGKLCPCCGGPLFDSKFMWMPESRVIIRDDAAVVLANNQALFFNALWRARHHGSGVTREAVFEAVYGHDPSGGPDSPSIINVMVCQMRKKLKAVGLGIETRLGPTPLYRLTGR